MLRGPPWLRGPRVGYPFNQNHFGLNTCSRTCVFLQAHVPIRKNETCHCRDLVLTVFCYFPTCTLLLNPSNCQHTCFQSAFCCIGHNLLYLGFFEPVMSSLVTVEYYSINLSLLLPMVRLLSYTSL